MKIQEKRGGGHGPLGHSPKSVYVGCLSNCRTPEKPSGTEDLLARSEARKKLPDKNLDFQVWIFILSSTLFLLGVKASDLFYNIDIMTVFDQK